MDSLEDTVKRLRELRADRCRRHIDQQIKSWLNTCDQPADSETIGHFLANLRHLESLDSDATESTSSNDSYDELEGFSHEEIPPKRTFLNKPHHNHPLGQRRVSVSSAQATNSATNSTTSAATHGEKDQLSDLRQKAIWKWAKDRARLASKWTWLQAQISDLEYRVRGQNVALTQAREQKMPPLPQALPNSCSRTTPLNRDFRQRRLIKSSQILSDSGKSSVKFSHIPCICASLPQTVGPCLCCRGRYNYLKQSEGETATKLEIASLQDPCIHPVLAFPDDIPLGSQISYLLRQETVVRKEKKGKPGRKKGSTSANSSNNATANNDKSTMKKGKFALNRPKGYGQTGHLLKHPSQTMIASNKLKRKYCKHSRIANRPDSSAWLNGNYHGHNNNSTKRNKRIRSASSMNESALHSDSSNPYRPSHFSNNTARNVTRRRRSEQSAYDIDNIVIPFSVAATARVEILEYKEILTPSWRLLENGICLTDTTNNKLSESPADDEEIEDTSDEVYIQRHTKGEHEEKKRFSLKPPPKNEVQNTAP